MLREVIWGHQGGITKSNGIDKGKRRMINKENIPTGVLELELIG